MARYYSIVLVCIFLLAACGGAVPVTTVSSATPTATSTATATATATTIIAPTQLPPTPTATARYVPSWKTVQRFAGTGEQHTPSFAVPTSWRITFMCGDGRLAVEVFNAHNVIVDPVAAQVTCPVSDSTMEQGLGTPVSLDITGDGRTTWVVQVQEFM